MTDASSWPVTIVESPYAGSLGERLENLAYLQRCCRDCLERKEVPFASHGFFTNFLDDADKEDREIGLTAGYAMWHAATRIAFYCDRGFSSGMKRALDRATKSGHVIEYRVLDEMPRTGQKIRSIFEAWQSQAKQSGSSEG